MHEWASSLRRNARDRAVMALVRSYEGEAFCHDLLAEMQAADPLPPADAALAAKLAIGVSRHRLTCEHIASRFYRGRWAGLRLPIRMILSLGVYQLCWLDRIPDHAAVDQSVRQARRHGRGATATVNAVLRKVAHSVGEAIDRPGDPDPRHYLPIDETRGRLFDRNIFPDPARRPLEALIATTSHPPWLVERWHRRYKPTLCRRVCEAGIRRPPLVLRPNSTRITAKQLHDRLVAAGHRAAPTDDGLSISLQGDTSASELSEIRDGLCQPQDSTAGRALRLSPPRPRERVLDFCAGVGTKSTQAAEMMNNTGVVIATDADASKLDFISAAAGRLGLTIIRPVPMDRLSAVLAEAAGPPDVILLDVPCLNTGVLARRPEARYRAGAKSLKSIVEIQRGILHRVRAMAGDRTRIIYSTCSLEPEENEQQIEAFCEAFTEWVVAKQELTLPDQGRDGGFAAVLVNKTARDPQMG